jgi:hypothetical protein
MYRWWEATITYAGDLEQVDRTESPIGENDDAGWVNMRAEGELPAGGTIDDALAAAKAATAARAHELGLRSIIGVRVVLK